MRKLVDDLEKAETEIARLRAINAELVAALRNLVVSSRYVGHRGNCDQKKNIEDAETILDRAKEPRP